MGDQILNISPLVAWVVVLSQMLTFGLTIWNLMASGSRVNSRRLDDHAKRLDVHEQRLGSIEQTQSAGPTAKDLHELELAMQELRGEIRTMSAVMNGNTAIMTRLEAIVGRHEDRLLKE